MVGFTWELSTAAIGKQRGEGGQDDAGWEARLAKLKAYVSESTATVACQSAGPEMLRAKLTALNGTPR